MGLTDSLFSGISGLRTMGHAMSVLGDNVSNLNTTAFKGSRISFQDIMAQSINTASGSGQLGRGTTINDLSPVFNQGSFETTASPTDLAIAGNGFFMVKEPGTDNNIFYTRAGQFRVDREGYLINPAGYIVQGWNIDEDTNDITGAITDIQIARSSPPVETSLVDVITNLDAREELDTVTVELEGDITTGSGTASQSTTFVVRDISGQDYKIYTYLYYDADNQLWDYEIRLNDASGKILASGEDVSTTKASFTLPDSQETIVVDWSGVLHTSDTDSLSAPGRTGLITLAGTISANTSAATVITVTDSSGNSHSIHVTISGTGSTWAYTISEVTSGTTIVLASAVTVAETDAYFYLNGTDQRVNIDWSSLNITTTAGDSTIDRVNTYNLTEVSTLYDAWNAENDSPLSSSDYTYRTTLTIYDSLGTPHEITIYYDTTTRENVYEFLVTCDPGEDQRDFTSDTTDPYPVYAQDSQSGMERIVQSASTHLRRKKGVLMYGRLEFDNQGNVKKFYETYRVNPSTGELVQIVDEDGSPVSDPADGFSALGDNGYPVFLADFLGIELDLADSGALEEAQADIQDIELNMGYYYRDSWRSESVRTTQYATSFSTIFYDQNGFGPGFLETLSVDNDGVITGHYSNGRIIPLAKVALANFNAPEGLAKVGGNLYRETTASGPPITGEPRTNGLGSIAPNSLEQSNVDLGEQFVKMITTQRGFQADARVITTTDQMLEELINVKR
ncbi:flagellar hook-basal body complex protein [Thermosulfuriphilus ammonigenes]|uniref:Flagellar hook protein FlgE n=1 Tax=Thermosulfuriphilus ammonigenes TaxID=1936021 RepID=A0A6G7PY72_9BACT|nr:flagellar hook-basal body complex protein [Thermosulfuriphilus ammonigenes]MBA2849807.1 flagellar hook protein FlgE [Thermosulfuriphilus ammonigenes]QIJ72645.1 flagellar hook-basal body complex protein [Thermosulfuriphilus ammonigenes]